MIFLRHVILLVIVLRVTHAVLPSKLPGCNVLLVEITYLKQNLNCSSHCLTSLQPPKITVYVCICYIIPFSLSRKLPHRTCIFWVFVVSWLQWEKVTIIALHPSRGALLEFLCPLHVQLLEQCERGGRRQVAGKFVDVSPTGRGSLSTCQLVVNHQIFILNLDKKKWLSGFDPEFYR